MLSFLIAGSSVTGNPFAHHVSSIRQFIANSTTEVIPCLVCLRITLDDYQWILCMWLYKRVYRYSRTCILGIAHGDHICNYPFFWMFSPWQPIMYVGFGDLMQATHLIAQLEIQNPWYIWKEYLLFRRRLTWLPLNNEIFYLSPMRITSRGLK